MADLLLAGLVGLVGLAAGTIGTSWGEVSSLPTQNTPDLE